MSLPLQGIRVIDLSRVIAGPACAMNLADLGAEVIKVEPPGEGDHYRWHARLSEKLPQGAISFNLNRNKKSLTLDFKQPEGKALLLRLLARADVVVQNFRPGVPEKMGIDYPTLKGINPRLVYCSITGYGSRGRYKNKAGLDFPIQAESGLMSTNGEPDGNPMKISVPIVDLHSGLFASQGIVAALFERERTGRGREIEVSLFAVAVSLLSDRATEYLLTGRVPPRVGNHGVARTIVTDLFATRDGYVAVTLGTQNSFEKLWQIPEFAPLGKDPRFATVDKRAENIQELVSLMREIMMQKTTAEWVKILVEEKGLTCGPVRTIDQVFTDPVIQDLAMVQRVTHSEYGPMNLLGIPYSLPESPPVVHSASPAVGEHTEEILKEHLGLEEGEIQRLREKAIV
jgi:crotonobetainyl-CoA:carnitine CoA-transferase CaiB-like acyl-CoA transferase